MPRAKAITSSLSELIDSPAESSDVDVPEGNSNQENTTPPKRGNGRTKAAGTRKTKPASKRLSGGKAKTTAKRVTKRAPLKDTTNAKQRQDLEQIAEQEDGEEVAPQPAEQVEEEHIQAPEPAKPKRKGRPRKVKEPPVVEAPPQLKATILDEDFE